ncbi:thermonuclease family protein [Mesorhizobium sp.]|uniref:thermonuclease family protein n=1 Tax=Mesorhizobium sp. TaxID=1871066 RepID=UPI0025DE939D|nr:thermonuclease family protein [Mesorhizobium sp.]
MGDVVGFRKRRRSRSRRRGLLETPWLIPALVVMAVAGFYGRDAISDATGLGLISNSSVAAGRGSFRECYTPLDRTCVIDGDTIRLKGEKIRLLDIDAPEVRDYKCASEKERGDRATLRLVEILNSGTVSIERKGSRDVDQYGRSLRIVQVDGRSAGGILVAEGLARPWSGKRRPWCL